MRTNYRRQLLLNNNLALRECLYRLLSNGIDTQYRNNITKNFYLAITLRVILVSDSIIIGEHQKKRFQKCNLISYEAIYRARDSKGWLSIEKYFSSRQNDSQYFLFSFSFCIYSFSVDLFKLLQSI